jgi:hypothetical protein
MFNGRAGRPAVEADARFSRYSGLRLDGQHDRCSNDGRGNDGERKERNRDYFHG